MFPGADRNHWRQHDRDARLLAIQRGEFARGIWWAAESGQVYEDLSYTLGRHQLKFGGQYIYIQNTNTFRRL